MSLSLARTFQDCARQLRILYAIDLAHSLGETEEIVSLCANVDPIEVTTLAATLEGLAMVEESYSSGAEPTPTPPAPFDAPYGADGAPDSTQASAPVTYLWHTGDNWSKKA